MEPAHTHTGPGPRPWAPQKKGESSYCTVCTQLFDGPWVNLFDSFTETISHKLNLKRSRSLSVNSRQGERFSLPSNFFFFQKFWQVSYIGTKFVWKEFYNSLYFLLSNLFYCDVLSHAIKVFFFKWSIIWMLFFILG